MYPKDNKHKILNLHYIWVNYMCKMHKKNVLKYYIKALGKKCRHIYHLALFNTMLNISITDLK
jgi:hypothetical protein